MRSAIGLALTISTVIAHAEPRRDADEHARRGVALYNLGKYETAIDEFEQAYTLFQSEALLFNLAQAHRQLQHCERALYYYRRFLEGNPSRTLATQVEDLLPKLEAACRTKSEPPAGPVGSTPAADIVASAGTSSPGPSDTPQEASSAAGGREHERNRDPGEAVTNAVSPELPYLFVTAALSAGMVFAGKTAPTGGVRLTVTTPSAWLHGGELGGSIALGRLWRGDNIHNATLSQITGTIRYRAVLNWGRFTIGGELGAEHFSSLDYSSGVVPGVTTTAQWVPLVRAELGSERDIVHSLAVRVAAAVAMSPRMGPLLSSVGEFDLLIGVRYER